MEKSKGISFFEKYLSLWVLLCIIIGVSIGVFLPIIPNYLSKLEYANVSIPVAILIWLMIYPMMLKVDFTSIVKCFTEPKGLIITIITNWIIKPFTMYFFAYIFFTIIFKNFITLDTSKEYIAGAVLLGAAPCTAMVFVWSYLTKGNANYTLVQVAINDLIILVAFIPIVSFLLGLGGIKIPFETLILSVLLFVVIPLSFGYITRLIYKKTKGIEYFEKQFIPKFTPITIVGLLLTIIIIFSFQGKTILKTPIN
ncbi:MAG: arsenical-resistance protein, partial [Candidatus Woesearchaeota archaeon]